MQMSSPSPGGGVLFILRPGMRVLELPLMMPEGHEQGVSTSMQELTLYLYCDHRREHGTVRTVPRLTDSEDRGEHSSDT
jgi:hypothetical protein